MYFGSAFVTLRPRPVTGKVGDNESNLHVGSAGWLKRPAGVMNCLEFMVQPQQDENQLAFRLSTNIPLHDIFLRNVSDKINAKKKIILFSEGSEIPTKGDSSPPREQLPHLIKAQRSKTGNSGRSNHQATGQSGGTNSSGTSQRNSQGRIRTVFPSTNSKKVLFGLCGTLFVA